jgi:hypothetical protein
LAEAIKQFAHADGQGNKIHSSRRLSKENPWESRSFVFFYFVFISNVSPVAGPERLFLDFFYTGRQWCAGMESWDRSGAFPDAHFRRIGGFFPGFSGLF